MRQAPRNWQKLKSVYFVDIIHEILFVRVDLLLVHRPLHKEIAVGAVGLGFDSRARHFEHRIANNSQPLRRSFVAVIISVFQCEFLAYTVNDESWTYVVETSSFKYYCVFVVSKK